MARYNERSAFEWCENKNLEEAVWKLRCGMSALWLIYSSEKEKKKRY